MTLDNIIFLLALFLIITAFIMPWVVFIRQNKLENTLNIILKNQTINLPIIPNIQTHETIHTQTYQDNHVVENIQSPIKAEISTSPKHNISLEEQFGKNLPVWGGGIALALATFFLVKYSIDNNLLSPIVRIVMGFMFCLGLLYSAKHIQQKENFANGQRIAQSLAGAGIIGLYGVIFAAAKLYHMIPILLAFAGMSSVTAIALVLSLRHGMPIAVMALGGGFLTPVFLGGNGHSTALLFGYLFLIIGGLNYLVKKTQWWWLSLGATFASLLWVIIWLTLYQHGDGLWLGLFLMGICTINITNSKQYFAQNIHNSLTVNDILKPTSLLNYISLFGSIILMGFVVHISEFGILEWSLLWLLTLATIGLGYFNNKLYGFSPFVSLCAVLMLLLELYPDNYFVYFSILIVFAMTYILSGSLLIFQSKIPTLWACLAGIASLAFYLLGFFKTQSVNILINTPFIWGILAMFLAGGAIYIFAKISDYLSDSSQKEYLYAVCSVVATSFMTLGLYIELPYAFLSGAIATEMVAIAWINQKISIKALQVIIAILASIFGLILLPQFAMMFYAIFNNIFNMQLHLHDTILIAKYPLYQLGIPAIMFLITSYLLRTIQHNPKLINILESVAISLIAIMCYCLTRNILNPDRNILLIKTEFFERGIINNVFFLFGLLCFWIGRIYHRITFSWGGVALTGIALLSVMYGDVLFANPLWASEKINGIILLNSLILPYGLPILWLSYAKKECMPLIENDYLKYLDSIKLLLLFLFLSLNIRYFFHGEFLNSGFVSNAEIYSYSLLWLLLGGGLLYIGTLKQDKSLRISSLLIILLVVAKVFLYDTSELQGLYRVFSFLGLGISLIGISYFYSRFIFRDNV